MEEDLNDLLEDNVFAEELSEDDLKGVVGGIGLTIPHPVLIISWLVNKGISYGKRLKQ